MKNRFAKAVCKYPLNIQFFAEGDGAGAGDGNGGGSGSGSNGSGTGDGGSGSSGQSFDDFLKNGNQAEFDRRVNMAVETAVGNAREKWELLTNDKLSEAEKLSKMTKEEKAQYLAQKHEKELADREASITKRELMAEAKNTLTEKKLPLGLAEILNYTDAESCKSSMAAVEKAFQEAVEAAVEEKLKGGKPPKKAGDQGDDLAAQVEKFMIGY